LGKWVTTRHRWIFGGLSQRLVPSLESSFQRARLVLDNELGLRGLLGSPLPSHPPGRSPFPQSALDSGREVVSPTFLNAVEGWRTRCRRCLRPLFWAMVLLKGETRFSRRAFFGEESGPRFQPPAIRLAGSSIPPRKQPRGPPAFPPCHPRRSMSRSGCSGRD